MVLELQDQQDLKGHKESNDLRDQRVLNDLKELRVIREILERKVIQALQDLHEHKVFRVKNEIREILVQLV
jgi:hypothetical protein